MQINKEPALTAHFALRRSRGIGAGERWLELLAWMFDRAKGLRLPGSSYRVSRITGRCTKWPPRQPR